MVAARVGERREIGRNNRGGRAAQAPRPSESRVRLGLVGCGGWGRRRKISFEFSSSRVCGGLCPSPSLNVCLLSTSTNGYLGTFETFTPEASAQACRKACGRASWQGSRAHCNLLIVAFCPETAPAWHPATLGLAIVLPVLAERRHVASKGRQIGVSAAVPYQLLDAQWLALAGGPPPERARRLWRLQLLGALRARRRRLDLVAYKAGVAHGALLGAQAL